MRYHKIINCSVVDGVKVRCTLYLSGCSHHCKGCHNPETWDFNGGIEFDEKAKEELFSYLSLPYIDGVTRSGGDPMDSYDDVLQLVLEIKEKFTTKTIWIYTGYTLEQLIEDSKETILDHIDVLVDGEYVEELRDITLAFRGSSNQRILVKGVDF